MLHYYKLFKEKALKVNSLNLIGMVKNEEAGIAPQMEGVLQQRLQAMGGSPNRKLDGLYYGKNCNSTDSINLDTRLRWQRLGHDPVSEVKVDQCLERVNRPKISD